MKMFTAGGILATSVIVKMICGLILIKLFTASLSVSEFGQLSQFMALSAFLTTVSGGALTHGLIRELSISGLEENERTKIIRCAHMIFYASTAVIVLILIGWSEQITEIIVSRPDLSGVMFAVSGGFLFAGFNNLQISILSAAKRLKEIAISQSLGIVAGTLLTAVLLENYDLAGAIVGFSLIGLCNAFFSGIFVRKCKLLTPGQMIPFWNGKIAKRLVGYSAALIAAIAMMPGAHVIARIEIARQQGWAEIGYWQSISRLSDIVIQLFGTFFNNYLLALFSSRTSSTELLRILFKVIPGVAATSLMIFAGIYLFRNFYIQWFLTPEYQIIEHWLPFQFAGDVLRLAAAVGSYYFLSQRALYYYVGLEIIAAVSFILFMNILLQNNTQGVAMIAHLITYSVVLTCSLALVFVSLKSAKYRLGNNS